ncbi:ABC transporter permease [Chitinophaga barathri]|uniref:FtsX-like permease family protein n=1 Tax=Chitinophaga barathri TaxID=1647451 RepID=A0A3N4MIJ6_9BACT|nr:FtsX-like permease family protein [Chitinophaga barathri]RPD41876.1 FtsX-like permease family protein [Chitinophaga barathri]
MFYNYLKIALRSLRRKPSFTILNVTGLAVGIAAALLIFVVIRHELSYDNFHRNKDRIYRVASKAISRSNGETVSRSGGVPLILPETFRADFPQIEKMGVMFHLGQGQIYIPGKGNEKEKRFLEPRDLAWVDAGIFSVFDYTWLAGSAEGMTKPNTAVLAASIAAKYFGNAQEAIGKTIQLFSFRIPFEVVGVYKDQPGNSDMSMKIAFSYPTFIRRVQFTSEDWKNLSVSTAFYVQLRKDIQASALEKQLPAFVKKYYNEDARNTPNTTSLVLQPLRDIHLSKDFGPFYGNKFNARELITLGMVGLFLLIVACINFINLATALSVNRAKEIGVRKVMGSNRWQLMRQFLNETAFITLFSVILGVGLAALLLPGLENLTGKQLVVPVWTTLAFLFLLAVVVTLLAGFYPAMVVAGFNPLAALKNRVSSRSVGGISLRRGLVVFQFVIAQLLVIGTLVALQQMKLFREMPMGFDKDALLMVELPSDSSLAVRYPMLRTRMTGIPGVDAAAFCLEAPSASWNWDAEFFFDNKPEIQPFTVARQFGDTGFVSTFGIRMAAGRKPFASDTVREVLVNEMFVKKLGLPGNEAVLGKRLSFHQQKDLEIVGVVKDYSNQTLRDAILPVVITPENKMVAFLAMRLNAANMQQTLSRIEKEFADIYPTYLYDARFLDQRIGNYYAAEAQTALLFRIFAILAIFISCLGLYGLVSFMAVQKQKEVGIRKVLGASVQSILILFSKEFTLLIGIAFLIAAPLGYYFMNAWLEGFHYHITISWGVFALAVAFSIVIAWTSVGYKALRAALANPVKSLRSE